MFKRIGRLFLALFCVASLVAACGIPASLSYPEGKTLTITKNVWGAYQEYLTLQGGPRRDGAFLVVMGNDIGVSSTYSYCPPVADICTGPTINLANQTCIEKHLKCVLFARGSRIIVPYRIQ